ncbi:MAG: hypothetical protein ABW321_25540 [Polyangiales bacterium]
MTKLKALYVLQCIEFLREHHGDDCIARVQAVMEPTAREHVYSPLLLATDWIDVAYAVEHALAYDRVSGTERDHAASSKMISGLVARHYNGLYRPLFSTVATPLTVLEKSSRLWSRFYDAGESLLEIHNNTSVTKRIINCPDMPKQHDVLISPYYEELLRQSGARHVSARHTKCVAHGAETCEWLLNWRE